MRLARPRTRACLQDGLKLDLNWLARRGFIKFGANIGTGGIQWNHPAWDAPASGTISADMSNPYIGWLRIELGSFPEDFRRNYARAREGLLDFYAEQIPDQRLRR